MTIMRANPLRRSFAGISSANPSQIPGPLSGVPNEILHNFVGEGLGPLCGRATLSATKLCGQPRLSADKEVEHIHPAVCRGRIQLRVPTIRADYGDKPLVLHIEELGEVSARGLKLIGVVSLITAFHAYILNLIHALEDNPTTAISRPLIGNPCVSMRQMA